MGPCSQPVDALGRFLLGEHSGRFGSRRLPGRWWLSRSNPRRTTGVYEHICALDGYVSSSLTERPQSHPTLDNDAKIERKSCSEAGDAGNRPREEGAGETRR